MNAKSVPSLQPKNIDTRQDQLLLTAVLRRAQQILAISQIKRQSAPSALGWKIAREEFKLLSAFWSNA